MRRFSPKRSTVLWLLAFVAVAWALTRAPILEDAPTRPQPAAASKARATSAKPSPRSLAVT